MSVPKNKRQLSSLEFFVQAMRLREELTKLMLHDFGAKKKITNGSEIIFNNISGNDRKTILEILERENSNPVTVERFPSWFIEKERDFFLTVLRDLVCAITYANTIYPRSLEELEERRKYQTRAIGDCECILQELYFVQRVLNVNLNKMMPVVDALEREIFLIKAWRKSDNRFRKMIKKSMKNDPTLPAIRKFVEALGNYIADEERKEFDSIDFSEFIFMKEEKEDEKVSENID